MQVERAFHPTSQHDEQHLLTDAGDQNNPDNCANHAEFVAEQTIRLEGLES